jgi:hypothetical protein
MVEARSRCAATTKCVGRRRHWEHNASIPTETEGLVAENIGLITTGVVFAFLGAILIGFL